MTELEKLKSQLAAQAAQIAALTAEKNRPLQIKTSEKGCVSIYGLNAKFPVSLYPDQWEKLGAFYPTIQKYIAENKSQLAKLGEASKLARQAAKLQAIG